MRGDPVGVTRYSTQCTFNVANDNAGDDRRWIQVAAAGHYKGHPGGEFTLGRAEFSTMLRNFRAHPSYKADNGVGCADVLPFDFEHAIETATPEDHAKRGVPAQAWAQELQIRAGANGRAELWALCRYLPLAKKYVQQGSYKWTSIVFHIRYTNPVSGNEQGHTLTSIAFTNNPFIQGMQPIAARYGAAGDPIVQLALMPETLERVFSRMRRVFDLPSTAMYPEVRAQIERLRQLLAMPEPRRMGVDCAYLVGRLRDVLNLPALTEPAAVIEAALSAFPSEQVSMSANQSPIFTLAAALRVPHGTESEMQAAIVEKVRLADEQKREQDAFLKLLGVDSFEAARKLWKDRGDLLADLEPEVEDTRKALAKREIAQAIEDVEAVVAMRPEMADHKEALLSMRGVDIALSGDMGHEEWGKALAARTKAREKFAKKYPLTARDKHASSDAERLLSPIATHPQGGYIPAARMQLAAGAQPARASLALAPPPPGAGSGANAEDLKLLAAVQLQDSENFVTQCRMYLSQQPGAPDNFDALHDQAAKLAQRLKPLRMSAA